MPLVDDARVLVDAATRDDAAVYQLSEDRAVVATVDFFAPIVDDPFAFGAIAAANALSDCYAMGATPLFALNLVAWPRAPEMLDLLSDALRGGVETARRAGVFILGGHSIDDPEPKLGMVVVGEVAPADLIDNAGAQPGDRLVLTKPLGTGVLSTALKRDAIDEAGIADAVEIMATLNAGAARAMRAVAPDVHAATDITGFGLAGHLHNLLAASGVGATLQVAALPILGGVRDLIDREMVPGGTRRNLEAIDAFTSWADGVTAADQLVVADAQTSGGLMIAVAPERADALVSALRDEATPAAAVVGTVTEGPAGSIMVEP